MTKEQLETILSTIIRLEHRNDQVVTYREYSTIVELCKAVQAPNFVTEYFEQKTTA